MDRNIFDTLREAMEHVERPGVDLVIIPLNPDVVSDEDELNENDTLVVGEMPAISLNVIILLYCLLVLLFTCTFVQDVPGYVEIINLDEDEDVENLPLRWKKQELIYSKFVNPFGDKAKENFDLCAASIAQLDECGVFEKILAIKLLSLL